MTLNKRSAFASVLSSYRPYSARVLNTRYASLIGYWPHGEASGTTAIDLSSQGNNGTYTAITLAQPGYPAGGTSGLYDGSTSVCNIYSAALRSDFIGGEGSISLWCKINEAWSVSTARYLIRLYSAGSNQVRIYKSSTNRITLDYTAGSVTKSYEITTSDTDWFHLGMTWSKSNDRVRIYLDGVQVGADLAGLGTWSGNLASTATCIGAGSTAAANAWIGWISNVALWTAELTPTEMGFVGYGYTSRPEVYSGFSIAFIPDPQNYTAAAVRYHYYNSAAQWIADNATTYNIQAAACVGDVVDAVGTAAQWGAADAAFDILDAAEIPYLITNGNHDDDSDYVLTTFNTYFPTTRFSTHAWWTGGFRQVGHSETAYHLFTAGGVNYILITLQYVPVANDLTWLDALLTTHAARRAIIVTHAYLGTIDAGNQNERNAAGDSVWAVIKTHDNVIWVQSGHVVNEGVGRLISLNDAGHEVNQIVANYQGDDGAVGGSGAVRLVTFDAAGGRIYTQTILAGIDKMLTDGDNQFTLNYR